MSSADLATELRAQAATLDELATLENALLDAKAAYAADPSPQNRAAKQDAAAALREARFRARPDEVTVGGDAATGEES